LFVNIISNSTGLKVTVKVKFNVSQTLMKLQ